MFLGLPDPDPLVRGMDPDPDPLVRGMDPDPDPAGILKFNDENSRIRIQHPDPDPNPDPLVRGMDPRIRIRIHPKMAWIRNTAFYPYRQIR